MANSVSNISWIEHFTISDVRYTELIAKAYYRQKVTILASYSDCIDYLLNEVRERYGAIFSKYTFNDLIYLSRIHPQLSFDLYDLTKLDEYLLEKNFIAHCLSLLIFSRIHRGAYTQGPHFIPVINYNDMEYDLYSILYENYERENSELFDLLALMNVNLCEKITDTATIQ